MTTEEVIVKKLVCTHCSHKWIPRHWDNLPRVCPNCKSYDWEKGKIRKPKESIPTKQTRNLMEEFFNESK